MHPLRVPEPLLPRAPRSIQPNHKLLSFYGFAIPRNPHDFLNVSLDAPDDELAERREALMAKMGLKWDHQLVAGVAPRRLAAAVAVAVRDKEGLERMEREVEEAEEAVSGGGGGGTEVARCAGWMGGGRHLSYHRLPRYGMHSG